MVADAIMNACIEELVNLAKEKVTVMLGMEAELQKLLRMMERLSFYLEDADSKSFNDKFVGSRLGELKYIVYDAEEIIDRCRVQGTKLLRDHTPPTTANALVRYYYPFISCFTGIKFRREIGNEIQELDNRLEEIAKNNTILPKLERKKSVPSVHTIDYRQTSHLQPESDVVGEEIEKATHHLVKLLVEKIDGRKSSVFGIVGMGGIGKTTLARKIYNHASIADHFPLRVWLCVSQNPSEDLKKQVIRGVGGQCGEATSRDELDKILSSALTKKLFLVLDDVWGPKVWEDFLRSPLECGATSVQVLITTRDEKIAKDMQASIYNVTKMNIHDSWALLRKKVFGDCDDNEMFGLKDIGIKVVERCHGLPLAIKAIAGVLRSKKRTVNDWEKVLQSSAWSITELPEVLRGSLYLSYEDLRSDLKQCFLFCSLYPEGHFIYRDDLIRFWVAEGFIRANGDTIMEDLAEDYYYELIGRSLLQPAAEGNQFCNMHDLLRSLAQFLIGEENICLAGNASTLNSSTIRKIRRLSLAKTSESTIMPMLFDMKEQHSLRTMIFFGSPHWRILLENNIFNVLGCLRVLDLTKTGIKSLPDSVGTLVHLRLLDLSYTEIKELPESMVTLVNLQTLILRGCMNLKSLPKGIKRISSLRCLIVHETGLSHVPKGFCQLKELNCLEGFLVGDDGICGIDGWTIGCNMDELENLSKLKRLSIHNLERASIGTPAVKNKSFLKHVRWQFCESETSVRDNYADTELRKMKKVLEELVPPHCLEELTIENFPGCGYPSWMSQASLTSFHGLEFVVLSNCISWTQPPPLGQLPMLKDLRIYGADAIVTVGHELLGCPMSKAKGAFPKMEKLRFEDLKNWEEWLLDENDPDSEGSEAASKFLPRLTSLQLKKCPMLRSLPRGLGHATCLNELIIWECDSLKKVKNLPWLAKLRVVECGGLQKISNLQVLRNLSISHCPQLKDVENLDALRILDLTLNEAERLPEWLVELAEQQLKIRVHDTPTTSTAAGLAEQQVKITVHDTPTTSTAAGLADQQVKITVHDTPTTSTAAGLADQQVKITVHDTPTTSSTAAGLADQQVKITVHDTRLGIRVPGIIRPACYLPPSPPKWLDESSAMLLHLYLTCNPFLLRRCLKGGEDWPIIEKFPEATITSNGESMMYTRTPPTYMQNF